MRLSVILSAAKDLGSVARDSSPSSRLRMTLLAFILTFAACQHRSDLPKLFPVPNASLVSEVGKPVQLDANKGYVTVYDFIFTNCAGSCPMMTRTMQLVTKKVDRKLPVRFVSISVDPARDTPAVLKEYARRVRKNDARWTFLTGDPQTVTRLSVDGFKLAAGTDTLLHSAKFAIADKNGTIREYYSGIEDDAVDHVVDSVRDLAKE